MKKDIVLANNPALTGLAAIREDLRFTCEGQEHSIIFITPQWDRDVQPAPRHPLVVFLQGSGWTSPDRCYQLPQLCDYAKQGLAVALITHRNSKDGHPFPAYLKDAKAAIRYLRSQADELGINPERVAFFGTSSGGNTALLVGLTGDDPRYTTPDYPGYSDAVCAVVDCFGPTDLLHYEGVKIPKPLYLNLPIDWGVFVPQAKKEDNRFLDSLVSLLGRQKPIDTLKAMSPLYELQPGKAYPPFLIAQGDGDEVVPFSQSLKMHEALQATGADSTLVRVTGGAHEGNFWSEDMHRLIFSFLSRHLKA